MLLQVIGPTQGDSYLKMKLKDQNKALQILQESPDLHDLKQIQAPYVDLEVRGLPALTYFGDLVWQDAFPDAKGMVLDTYWKPPCKRTESQIRCMAVTVVSSAAGRPVSTDGCSLHAYIST